METGATFSAGAGSVPVVTLQTILGQFREDARSNRDLGDRFERLIVGYLKLDPIYAEFFSDVWMWNDWPDNGPVGDIGIDIVARARATGEYCAIQCKFYLPDHTISGKAIDKTTILFNSHITLAGIPPEAHEYVVNGKSAIDWIMERYQVTRDKDSGISNDPNDWAKEHNQPRYIIDLLKRVVRVSVETMKIVQTLPALNERLS